MNELVEGGHVQGAAESSHRDASHAVRFYESPASLAQIVSDFLGEGLAAGQPAIVVATDVQRAGILRELARRGFDVAALQHAGDLVLIDAQATLDTFMVDGQADAARFREVMCDIIQRACRGRTDYVLRIYGEMVDVLWKEGLHDAALRLEMLWNRLAATQAFSLLCGYAMGSFYKDVHFDAICAQHTHVLGGTREQIERRVLLRRAPRAQSADVPRRTRAKRR